MFIKLFQKIFGTKNDRFLKSIKIIVDHINFLEKKNNQLTDHELQQKTQFFRECLINGKTLDDLLPEAFSVLREASRRVLGMRHFDVQLLGGIALHKGYITEMCTGEGKTLTATLPAYLNAIEGKGVHIFTTNEYLVKRDFKKHAPLFKFLDLKVGINLSNMSTALKHNAYLSDILYGTNNEFCFDYLRDNMIFNPTNRVQRELNYALIDEVDSILIDESRTPLVISGPSYSSVEIYIQINNIIPYFIKSRQIRLDILNQSGYFIIDEEYKQISFTEIGLIYIEKLLIKHDMMCMNESLYSSNNIVLLYRLITALRAHIFFKKNVDYIIKHNKVLIIDEHTGRIMLGRRWSDGLHQAIEAKENVKIRDENKVLASISFQNYFKLYQKISGMSGTISTESDEFYFVYNLDTVIIPPHRQMIRKDMPDLIYMTESEKFDAIIQGIRSCFLRKQPVLVGTISIEKSEIISNRLRYLNIPHSILNAKFHEKEADIISYAGKLGAVTIATNMAGRGTDIVLGGIFTKRSQFNSKLDYEKSKLIWKKNHDLVVSLGGLHVIGIERHESRRIDNQLKGRAGRQGDPGSSRFYLSMEDTLIRIFSPKNIKNVIRNLGLTKGKAIEHPWINKAILHAQKKVENQNFEIRKQLLEYDNILDEQRYIIYLKRNNIVNQEKIHYMIQSILKDVIFNIIHTYCPNNFSEGLWDITEINRIFSTDFNLFVPIFSWINKIHYISDVIIFKKIFHIIKLYYEKRKNEIGEIRMYKLEKYTMLRVLDSLWVDHLLNMEHLRKVIHFRGYAQKDPYQEYKRESFILFSKMLDILKYKVISNIIKNCIFLKLYYL
ncbi:preprotein translocase subunit SecA [Buchnera aphidicola]